MARILYGKPVAESISEKVLSQAEHLKSCGIYPALAIIRVGNNGSQVAYEHTAVSRMAKLGLDTQCFAFKKNTTQGDLLDAIDRINKDPNIHGCIVLLPLPAQMDDRLICGSINPLKDVDGVTNESISAVFLGEDGFSPCAPSSCIELFDYYNIDLKGKNVCVVGRSLVVGRPLSMLLLSRDATVTICHSSTKNLAEECRKADIIIAAAGSPGLITADHVRSGQTIIDVGITAGSDGKLHGDTAFDEISRIVSAITPVPGGIGIIAGSILAKNLISAAEKQNSSILN